MCGCLSHAHPGDLAHNPGMCHDWESNWLRFDLQAGAQSTEPQQPGLINYFYLSDQLYILLLWCNRKNAELEIRNFRSRLYHYCVCDLDSHFHS